jgi:ribose 1,5-bisphosphokinase PhnN
VLRSTPEQIKRAYELAVAKGYTAKAEVLKKFILTEGMENGEQVNERRAPRHIAKHFDRERNVKNNRLNKVAIGRLPYKEASPVSQD